MNLVTSFKKYNSGISFNLSSKFPLLCFLHFQTDCVIGIVKDNFAIAWRKILIVSYSFHIFQHYLLRK